jgi:inosine-uridine nucleoside N-ribohydrolase
MTVETILVDTDPALGLPYSDVDDAVAIYTLVAGKAPVVGLTTVFGNNTLERVHLVAEAIGARLGLPVFRGARGPGDAQTPAVDRLCAHDGAVLAIGPLTNIAAALARGARWSRLIVLGGASRRLPNLRPLHTTELNFALDEAAAAAVLPHVTTLFPMEPCRTVHFDAAHFGLLPPWLAEPSRHWLRLGPLMTGRRAVHPWDVLPALWMLDATPFASAPRGVRLATGPLRRGYIAYDAGPIEVITGIDSAAVIRSFSSVVQGMLPSAPPCTPTPPTRSTT